jgi:MinD-like ATPase involved in chromosome partitioning or flagellar assembly
VDSVNLPSVITAIPDPEFEGLVSGALYQQGWDVVARVMDISELRTALLQGSDRKILVIYSLDLGGITINEINSLATSEISFFGFADQSGNDRGFKNIFARPNSPDELILLILENIRFAGARTPLLHGAKKCRSKVIAIGGVGHTTGNTTIAINVAQEIALIGRRVLLVEANFQAPSISFYLDLRKVSQEILWREVSEKFSVMELTQENISGFDSRVISAGDEFDVVVIDLGSLAFLTEELSDRRWVSAVKIWATRYADEFIFTIGNTPIDLKRFEDFSKKFSGLSIGANTHLVLTEATDKRSSNHLLSKEIKVRNSTRSSLPWDSRTCLATIAERSTLALTGSRSALRKEIQKLAQSLVE